MWFWGWGPKETRSGAWGVQPILGSFFEALASSDASGGSYGASGMHKTGLGSEKHHPRSIFIDFTNIIKVKCDSARLKAIARG